MASPPSTGTLFIVSTPIGNLRDITLRALDVLRHVHLVVAEDTRHSRKLLTAFGIRARLMSLHARSSSSQIDGVIEKLQAGLDVAYVTDAGSPTVSDPGSQVVDRALEQGIDVHPIPGPSALTAALACAGLKAADFRFLGFLPRGRGKRLAILQDAASSGCAVVLFEAPRRVRSLLLEIGDVFPDRTIAACRELTKIHEEIIRGTTESVLADLSDKPRGEFTIVVASGTPATKTSQGNDEDILLRARELRGKGMSSRQVSRELAGETGRSRKSVYQLIIEDES